MTATSFNVHLRVHVDEPSLLPKIRERLPPVEHHAMSSASDGCYSYVIRAGHADAGSDRQFCVGYAGETPFARTNDECEALAAFESAARFDVAVASTRWLFVHAGVVGWRGRAIVLPAASHHGKSRLVEALVRAGAVYYSDEYAVFDDRGQVHAFPSLLSLRQESGGTQRVAATSLGGTIGAVPLRIGIVVRTRYERGQVWRPRRGTRGEGVIALLANCVRARLAPGPVLTTLARAVECAVVLDGVRGEADQTAPNLLRLLQAGDHAHHEGNADET